MRIKQLLSVSLLALAPLGAGAAVVHVPMEEASFTFSGDDYKFEVHGGRQAMFLRNSAALLDDVGFQDGMIEFDILLPDAWSFHGLNFRDVGEGNYEQFYMRPTQSGHDDALQYTPNYHNSAGWQFYAGEGFWANVDLATDRWMHWRVVISGDNMKVYMDHGTEPVLESRLRHDSAPGGMSLMSAQNGAWYSNFAYVSLDAAEVEPFVADPLPEGTVTDWMLSDPVTEADLPGMLTAELMAAQSWQRVMPEENAVVNVNKVHANDYGGLNTVYLKTSFARGTDNTAAIAFGYSDRVRVYYNGELIYSGNNRWRSRDFRYLGTIGLFDTVYLDTTERELNELVFAVSEDFGGWGVTAQWVPEAE